MNNKFTEEQVIELAREMYGKPICLDMLKDAMMKETVEDAAQVLIIDSAYWDGTF